MTNNDPRYYIEGTDVSDIRNKNEIRIIAAMQQALKDMGSPNLSPKTLRDAYALSLNLLPARYKQKGTIILREPIKEDHLQEAVTKALKQVLEHPKN